MSAELRRLSRRQLLVLFVVAFWLFLLALGWAGGTTGIAGVPHTVTATAGLVAIVSWLFVIPSWYMYALVREQGVREGSASWLAIRRRWWLAFSGGLVGVVGALLLVPTARATLELRIVGVIALPWGILCISTAVLAFRKRRLSRRPTK
jgi:hypothetical protein